MKALLFPLALAGLCLAPATAQTAPEPQAIPVQERNAVETYLLECNIAFFKAKADYLERTGACSLVDSLREGIEFVKTYPLHTLPAEHQAFIREYYDAVAACLEETAGIENQAVAMEVISEKLDGIDEALAKKYPRAHRDLGSEANQSFDAKYHIPKKLSGFLAEHPELLDGKHTVQLTILACRYMAEELEKLRK